MVVPFVCSRRRLKRHPHKSLRKRIRGRQHSISTSAAVGSFEGRRHCSDHLLSVAMVFPLSSGVRGRGGAGEGRGWGEKSRNLKKDYINHLLCNPFTVPGLVKNCCKHRGHSLTMQLLITVLFFLNLLIVCGSDKQEWVGEKNLWIGFSQSLHCIQTRNVSPAWRWAFRTLGEARWETLTASDTTRPARSSEASV